MIKVDQTIFDKGAGNCLTACVASIFELSIEDSFYYTGNESDNTEWLIEFNKFLAPRGYCYVIIDVNDDVKELYDKFLGYHIIIGDSPRFSEELHAVVGYKGDVWFDPHPSRASILLNDNLHYGLFVPTII